MTCSRGYSLAEGLTNPDEAQLDVPAGDYPVSIVPAGGGDPLFSVDAVPVAEGEALIAYAIGTVEGPFISCSPDHFRSARVTVRRPPAMAVRPVRFRCGWVC